MSTLILNYDVLSAVSRNASHLASRVDAYANDLTLKVANKTGSVAGAESDYLSDARYFVNQKNAALKKKHECFMSFSAQVTALATTAKRVDAQVSKMLTSSHERFLSAHKHLRIDGWKTAIYNWLTDLKNACPLFALIGDALGCLETEFGSLSDSIKHWYRCEGGKEIFEFVAAIGGAILAVALFIITLPASGFFLICAAIGAAIAVVNAMTNVYTSLQAVHAAHSGDPAWARVYGKQATLPATLRATNFGNGLLNRLSYGFAFAIDAVQTFCAVVGLVYVGVNIARSLKNIIGAKNTINKSISKPSWRQSELDAANDFPGYSPQKSFINGKEVSYGTKGSVRPDFYKPGNSIEIKSYNITTSSGRNNLVNTVSRQYNKRLMELPAGTKQTVMIDIRGQEVAESVMDLLYNEILRKSENGISIIFKIH